MILIRHIQELSSEREKKKEKGKKKKEKKGEWSHIMFRSRERLYNQWKKKVRDYYIS